MPSDNSQIHAWKDRQLRGKKDIDIVNCWVSVGKAMMSTLFPLSLFFPLVFTPDDEAPCNIRVTGTISRCPSLALHIKS
ncbi:hypothetical protein RRG08_027377 [Elysia crispata]|uniref:Uncharacterized protein n=1 Tax=Elysia crispata TaxID=231223 RepID=A0AAE0YM82_9GAST|nr:hypothetical protein RRG08_027377 [Elysia crispata]